MSIATLQRKLASAASGDVVLRPYLTELVINALKHAFPEAAAISEIHVDFRKPEKYWTLEVPDNGVGMPGNAADAKPGLGTGIVNGLAAQLSATITMTGADPGTVVTLVRQAPRKSG